MPVPRFFQGQRGLALSALSLLSACVLPLPPGSYEPEKFDAGSEYDEPVDDSGTQRPAPPPPPLASDAQVPSDPTSQRLVPLAKRYLVRIDVVTLASTKLLGGTLEVKSRASNLLVTRLDVKNGKLEAQERLCHQVFEHVCLQGCSKVETTTRSGAIDMARKLNSVRTYELDAAGHLSTSKVTMQLGYADPNPEAEPPATTDDERVWDVYPAQAGNEGMMTAVNMTVLGVSGSCVVFNTQRHESTFRAELAGVISLTGVELVLDSKGTTGRIIGAAGDKAKDCSKEPASQPTVLQERARFAEVDLSDAELFKCPSEDLFQDSLPAGPWP